jgi:pimeloyl-ACP methyl ester carboxylesterase
MDRLDLVRRLLRILVILLVTPPLAAAIGGWLAGPSFLHPIRRELSADSVRDATGTFLQIGARREEFDVRERDGILLRGWKVTPRKPTGDWVVLFHGVADNRMGVMEHARVLLLAGYGVVMMDARAHGASEGSMATYGWLERIDSRAIVDALETAEHPRHLFALGESMGAGIALQSAAIDTRIESVVAEAAFASLQEAAYDYAGLQRYPWLGKTLLAPGAWMVVFRGERIAGFPAVEVSPERAVAARPFPVLLICDQADTTLPCRHTERIYGAAIGYKELWVVPRAFHTAALGYEPEEFKRRVLNFFNRAAVAKGAGSK